jgi:hypothetical protein
MTMMMECIYMCIYISTSTSTSTSGNDNDEEIEEHNKKTAEIRLDSIASLFTQESAVLSLKSGKEILKGNKAIR